MAQERLAGPEYFTEFDPEKFIRDMQLLGSDSKKNADGEEVEES